MKTQAEIDAVEAGAKLRAGGVSTDPMNVDLTDPKNALPIQLTDVTKVKER